MYKNELDKACFQHDMAYGKAKDVAKRTESNKGLRNKAFKITSDPKYDGYQRGLASTVHKFFNKKYSGSGIANEPNYHLANELKRVGDKLYVKWKRYDNRFNSWVDKKDLIYK